MPHASLGDATCLDPLDYFSTILRDCLWWWLKDLAEPATDCCQQGATASGGGVLGEAVLQPGAKNKTRNPGLTPTTGEGTWGSQPFGGAHSPVGKTQPSHPTGEGVTSGKTRGRWAVLKFCTRLPEVWWEGATFKSSTRSTTDIRRVWGSLTRNLVFYSFLNLFLTPNETLKHTEGI